MEEKLNINGKEVIIKKLPLKKYADLLGAFEELPKHLDLIQGKSQDEIIVNLPKLISTCYPDVVRVVQVATDLTDKEVDDMGLDDLVSIIDSTLRVNNYSDIYSKIKKLTARPIPQPIESQSTGSGGQ